ncbi:hypothetical protein [Aestuariivivens sediminis]|uniref:hypothetical protein n=1 Tax=Aestuariivivens sediminis TaxID=2913557 RepID=UPI001F5ABC81|nr:hypothetical protein [Aestuariivivens sediminis]
MMENKQNKKWGLNKDLKNLTVRQRIDALVLLYFLNEYREQNIAFKKLKSHWTNMIYKLPETSDKAYNSVKNGRYNILSRMKKLYNEHVVKL